MKRKIFFITASITLFAANVFAQDEKAEEKQKPAHAMNIFKVNLTAIVLKNYSFQYERIINRKFSFALGFRTMPNGKLPLQSTIEKIVGDDAEAKEQIANFNLGNTAITPEFRFYVSKKGYGQGFYLAPFYRNATYKGSGLKFTYQNSAMVESTVSMSGELKSNTFGLMLGAQWHLGKHISLDWWILGPHYGNGKGDFTGVTSAPMTVDEQADLKKELDDFDMPFGTKKVTVNANGANVKLDGAFGGVRAGILIGVRF
ncbi:hypothetical protein [Ferruginibacter sp.]|nr:DUF3575 domain-containing protein [Ferruginibacter sp.]